MKNNVHRMDLTEMNNAKNEMLATLVEPLALARDAKFLLVYWMLRG